jgi:signal transduction histidine kinase
MQVFTSLLVLSIVFTVFVVTDINGYKKRKVEGMVGLAQVVGTNSVSILQFKDEDAGKLILTQLNNISPDIVHSEIFDSEGKVFASFTNTGTSAFDIGSVLKTKKFAFFNDRLFIQQNIITNDEVIGKVLMQVELSELQKIKQSKYHLSAILLLVALVLSFLIAYVIQGYISKRLLRLVKAMKNVSETGQYKNNLSDEGKEEISTLIKVFNNLMEQIKESQQRKDEFIGIASHELKTPLTTIKGYIDVLNSMENQQPQKQFVEKALGSVQKLEGLIKDLLDVSKIQSGQLKLTITRFYIDDVIDETIDAVKMVSASHKIIRKKSGNRLIVSADRQRIEQVLENLLSNAIKYSAGEQEVWVDTEVTKSAIIISVKDFGKGVPKEEHQNIFERFYRSKDSSVHISGFGLGLYICRDIINRHNGKIWVESDLKGSTFYFSLPLKKQAN